MAIGLMGPDVTASAPTYPDAKSSGDAYWMPALGWLTKQGDLAYGVGMFAQGGMGTEYKANSFMSAGSGLETRSEVSVGRLLVPISFNVNPSFTIGGSVDLVWAGMDLKMAMPGSQMLDMIGGSQSSGTIGGSMTTALLGAVSGGILQAPSPTTTPVNWGYFDFSDSSGFTGEAKATGFGGKIGAVFKANQQLSIGVTYHTKTALSDLETSNASVMFNANVDDNLLAGTWNGATGAGQVGAPAGTYSAAPITLKGKIKVNDFQWPATLGVGAAFQATNELMIVADVKRILWADVMKNFSMTFTSDATQSGLGAGFAGTVLDASLLQKWDDQTVIALGASYMLNPETTLRVGYNHASNPIPDSYLNALFPAIEETHITAGVGYMISKESSIDFSLTDGLETKATNSQTQVKSTMSQLNWQFMYSYRY
ncbi:MAG: outer membrane protein transport protein [Gammaproteobacteria bacterium]|nr:outer membrane protein transport protein [Gammaproteobacteria bacterium]